MADLLERLAEALDDAERLAEFGHPWPFGKSWVVRQVVADRKILELHTAAGQQHPQAGGWYYCTSCGSGEAYEYPTEWPCPTLLALAEGYDITVEEPVSPKSGHQDM